MKRLLLLFIFTACSIGMAAANTITVTSTADAAANNGECTLREAIIAANTNTASGAMAGECVAGAAGLDTIGFGISGSGVQTITLTSALPTISQPVIIDGYTQPGSKANALAVGDDSVHLIELTGNGVIDQAFMISAGQSTLRGLIVNRFGGGAITLQGGDGNTLEGNWMGISATGDTLMANGRDIFIASSVNNLVGGTTPAARNVLAGSGGNGALTVFSGGGATIQGNYVGVNAQGTAVLGSGGLDIASGGNLIGGTTPGAGNVIAGSRTLNIGVGVAIAANNLIQGNFIGANAAGTQPLGNTGVRLAGTGTDNNIISGNLISGNNGNGQVVIVAGSGNKIQGNAIGSPNGTLLNGPGIRISGGNDTAVGGVNPGEGNVIAFNSGDGVSVSSSSSIGNSILGNSIHSNGGLGIDLSDDGVTTNDACDVDTGNLQNYPIIKSVANTNGSVNIIGTFNSAANTTFRLEFFSNDSIDPTGFGEGQLFLGFANVTTDANCNATFDVTFPTTASAQRVTATATDPSGNTSEFSTALGQLLNISTRLRVETGDNVLIGGFIVTGSDPKRVVIRGIGPSLAGSVAGFLADPILELHDASTTLATNDNWKVRPDGGSQQGEIEATTIPPTNDLESALVRTLPANNSGYTAILRGKDNTTGIGVIEAYDLDQGANSRLANISTRGLVETGNNILIGGFIAGNGLTKVIVRAIGPTLANASVSDPLQNPILELHNNSGATIAMNDDWQATQKSEIEATGIPPNDPRESAIVSTLPPGNYTAVVRGVDNTTGIALVEVYSLN